MQEVGYKKLVVWQKADELAYWVLENRKFSKEEMYGISSEGKITPGYWLCEINPIPLYSELYSYEADGFESENEQILKVIKAVKVQTNNRGILI